MQEAWYAKLKESGFEDAEEMIAGEMVLKQVAEHVYRGAEPEVISAKEDYFRILRDNVRRCVFRSKTDRIILLLRADGAKMNQIADTLMLLGKRRCRMTVRMTIRKYEMEWGIRKYSPKQLNKKVQRSA